MAEILLAKTLVAETLLLEVVLTEVTAQEAVLAEVTAQEAVLAEVTAQEAVLAEVTAQEAVMVKAAALEVVVPGLTLAKMAARAAAVTKTVQVAAMEKAGLSTIPRTVIRRRRQTQRPARRLLPQPLGGQISMTAI